MFGAVMPALMRSAAGASVVRAALPVAGCGAREAPPPPPAQVPEADAALSLPHEEVRQLLCVVVDQSGSFEDLVRDDGPAWALLTKAMRDFYQVSAGEEGQRRVLGQISGSPRAPLFDDHPKYFPKRCAAAG